MSFLSGFSSIFSTEDERARQDREAKQRQRQALQDAAHFRQQAEQITLPFQAEVFRREADAKIKGLELRLNQDKAQKEGMAFRQFADETVAPTVRKLAASVTPTPDPLANVPDWAKPEARLRMGLGTGDTSAFDVATAGKPQWAREEALLRASSIPGHQFQSILPEPALNAIGSVPVAGDELRRVTEGMTSPIGLAATGISGAVAPAATLFGTAGTVAGGLAGQGLEELGVPKLETPIGTIGARSVGEIAGGLYTGPGGGGRRLASAVDENVYGRPGGLARNITRQQFDQEVLYRGVNARNAANPNTFWTDSLDLARFHAGPNGKIRVALKRDIDPEFLGWETKYPATVDETLRHYGVAGLQVPADSTPHIIAEIPASADPFNAVRNRPGGLMNEAGGTQLGHTGFPEEVAAVQAQRADPVTKMTNWMNEQAGALKASRTGRRAQVAELHGRQATILQDVYRNPDLTPQQQLETGLQRLPEAGTAGRADFTPPPISETETGELFAKIRDYPLFQNRPFKALNAQKGLASLMNGDLPGQYELGLLEQVFGPEFVRASAKQSGSKWRQLAVAAGLPRTVRTILDVSWPLRQGAGALPRHPKEVVGNAPRGVRAFFSENVAQQWDEATRMKGRVVEIVGDDGVPKTWTIAELQDEVGLYLPRIDQEVAPLAERTEEFMATQGGDTWVGKLSGKGILGFPIRSSQRSFITMGNATRSDIFENTITGRLFNLGKQPTMEDARGLAWLINVATGRGDLGDLNKHAALLAQPIFSPRLLAARIEHGLSPAILATGAGGAPRSLKASALAAQQLVTFVGTGVALATLASQVPGVRSEANALSTKFGKLEIGFDPTNPLKDTTKIDLFGGYQQYARTIAQLYTAKGKSDTGEIYEKDRMRIFLQFARGKVSPNVGTVLDVILGETAVGDKVDLKTAAGIRTFLWNEFSPLSFNDIVEAVNRDDGFRPEYGLLAPISASGGGVQTYGGRPSSVIYSMPYYQGVDAKTEEQLKGFMDEVEYEYQRIKAVAPESEVSKAKVALALGQSSDRVQIGELASAAFNKKLPLNLERIQFALDHQDDLEAKTLLGAVPDGLLRQYLTPENFDRVFKR